MTFNYISTILLDNITDVYLKLLPPNKKLLDEKTYDIIEHLSQYDSIKFKKYNNMLADRDYKIVESYDVILKDAIGFDNTIEILNILNHLQIFILHVGDKDICIKIYHNKNDDITILNENINKIMTRLWNLFQIFGNKKYQISGHEKSMINYEFIFYLYNNPRRANKNKKGDDYLKKLSKTNMKCFNTSSGMTDQIGRETDGISCVVVSKLEETLGLLTHEALHSSNLILAFNKNIKYFKPSSYRFDEMYVNAFATIFHSFLISKEYELPLVDILKNELLYCINQSCKLSLITGYDLNSIYNRKENLINWYQDAFLYEYINGRMLVLLNFKDLLTNIRFKDTMFSKTVGWDNDNMVLQKYAGDKIIEYHNKNKEILLLYNDVNVNMTQYLSECTSCKLEDEDTCGHMIMQYFAYDPLTVLENKKILNLYGGGNDDKYKAKYLKYKIKYFLLRKNTLTNS